MSEKTGNLDKITYDFNTSGNLEINLPAIGWRRVTPREFRSFDGHRRITEPVYVKKGIVNTPMKTVDYYGPVYYWGTNKEVGYTGQGKLIDNPLHAKFLKISGNRK